MKNSFTQSMSWLHTWAGLFFGWLLFAIFVTGTLAVFDKEIDQWMRPEIRSFDGTQLQAAQRGLDYLMRHAPTASQWNINLPDERSSGLQVSSGERRRGGGIQLDPRTGEELIVRETAGGSFFFRFHFTLNLPRNWGFFVVGALAIIMLVGLVSGIVIHKKIFKEFFTFRPNKGQRSWLDFHNASAVLLLPFHLMITYTGLVVFLLIYMPAAVDSLFQGDTQAYSRAANDRHAVQPPSGPKQPAALTELGPVLIQAQQRLGQISGIGVRDPGTTAAVIEVRPTLGYRIALTKGQAMLFDGANGTLLQDVPDFRPSTLTQRVMAGLHFAQFGGYPLRWIYFLCALISCAMIATGLVLFSVKRSNKYDATSASARRWYKVAHMLNVACVAGLLLACIGLLWANRLLPQDLPHRASREVQVFFCVWLLTLLHAGVRPPPRAWAEQLGLTAALCITLPVLGSLTVLSDPLHRTLEASSVVIGILLAYSAWRCVSPRSDSGPARSRARTTESQ